MARMLFVNLPVHDLDQSVSFFTRLGFEFDGRYTDENATCLVVNELACVMLLVQPFFSHFTTRVVADTRTHVESVLAVSAGSRQEVDTLVDTALRLGGTPAKSAEDHGYVYGRSFHDLDGHAWEVIWMDPSASVGQ